MPTTAERLGIVETKVVNLTEKLDTLQADVKEMHACLDRTRDLLDSKLDNIILEYRENNAVYHTQLKEMKSNAETSHTKLEEKISSLEKLKTKYTTYGVAALAFIAGTGWITNDYLYKLLKLFLG